MILYFGPAVVAAASPLTVTMPRASTPQAAAALGGATFTVGANVLVVVVEGGATYVLGTVPA